MDNHNHPKDDRFSCQCADCLHKNVNLVKPYPFNGTRVHSTEYERVELYSKLKTWKKD